MTASALPLRRAASSPYIRMAPWQRVAVVTVILLLEVVTPALDLILHGRSAAFEGSIWALEATYAVLLCVPFILYQPTYGWLHPLLFSALLPLAFRLAQDPLLILDPILVWTQPVSVRVRHIALVGWSEVDVASAVLKWKALAVLGLLAYYAGFFGSSGMKAVRLRPSAPRAVGVKSILAVGASLSFLAFYLWSRGGLSEHMLSWASGRFTALSGDGPIQVVIQIGALAVLLWMALDPRAIRRPAFWAAAAVALPSGFLASGSRSSLIYALVMMILIWTLQNRRLPTRRIVLAVGLSFVAFGALGSVRSSIWTGKVDWAVFQTFNIDDAVQSARLDAEWRATNSGPLVVMAKVPREADFLYGKTYLGGALFFVPRSLWPTKPRSAGGLSGERLFGWGPGSSAVPTGALGEAYWNFSVLGVLVVFMLWGVFHRWLASFLLRNDGAPAAILLYVLALFLLEPTGEGVTRFLQKAVPAVVLLMWMGGLRTTRSRNVARAVRPRRPVIAPVPR